MRLLWLCCPNVNLLPASLLFSHPGGSLGRKLLLTVEDIMHSGADNPVVNGATTVQDALFVITDKGLGAVSVVDDNEIMIGVLTDGDIRRGLSKGIDFLQRPVTELMTRAPKLLLKINWRLRHCI